MRRHPESVNLMVALEELIKNSMVIQSVSLCIDAVENIESMRRIASGNEDLAHLHAYYATQFNMAVDFCMMVVSEVFKRVERLDEKEVPKDDEKELVFMRELRK